MVTVYFETDACELPHWDSHLRPLGMIGELPNDTYSAAKFHWGETGYQDSTYAATTPSQIGSGPGKLIFSSVLAFGGFSDKSVVFLEGGGENSIERYSMTDNGLTFTNKSAGGKGDADDKFNNPIDITVDKNDNVYVLDILSNGQPRVKKFSSSLSSLGGFGSSTEITGKPVAIDADNLSNAIQVLHVEGIAKFPQ